MIKMVVKKPAKTYCKYCKKVLSDPKEIKLNHHESCNDTFQEFEKIHKKIEEQLAISLGLNESKIVEFLEKKNIKYTLNENMELDDLKISNTNIPDFKLSTSYLNELRTLSITNSFLHEEWMYNRDPSYIYKEGVIYKDDLGLKQLPNNIGELKNLKTLILSGNTIKNFPEEILELKNLKELTLEANDLKKLPEIITKMSNLESLNLSYNPLQTLPNSFVNLINLKKLVFNYECNHVEFFLPSNFGNLLNLEELRIISCKISSLPETFANLKALRILEISGPEYFIIQDLQPDASYDNYYFTFKLPPNFGILPKLEELKIICCHLGTLPESFSNLKSLRKLDITNDYKYFLDPKAFELFPNTIRELNIERNEIKKLPKEITNLKDLQLLNLKNNPVAKNSQTRGKGTNKLITDYFIDMKKKNGLIITT